MVLNEKLPILFITQKLDAKTKNSFHVFILQPKKHIFKEKNIHFLNAYLLDKYPSQNKVENPIRYKQPILTQAIMNFLITTDESHATLIVTTLPQRMTRTHNKLTTYTQVKTTDKGWMA